MYLAHAVRRSPRRAQLAACAVLVAFAAFALVWIGRASAVQGGPSGPAAVSKTVSTVIGKADAIDATDQLCTRSFTFQGMLNTNVTFKLGGSTPRSVLVLFQGEWNTGPSNNAHIRLMIDGIVQSGPNDVIQLFDDLGTHGFNFVSDPLAPGQHFANIQWRSVNSGSDVCVSDRSLIVLHK